MVRRRSRLPVMQARLREEDAMPVASQQVKERCITNCVDCVRAASRCVNECVSSDDAARMAECVRLCLDCVDLCGACVTLLSRDSRFAGRACEVCAEICEACAAECGKYAEMGDVMRECADACRRCAESCRRNGRVIFAGCESPAVFLPRLAARSGTAFQRVPCSGPRFTQQHSALTLKST